MTASGSAPRGGISDEILSRAGNVLSRTVALRLDPTMQGRLRRSLEEAAGDRGADVADFVESLARDPSALQSLLDRITVQETAFFRDPGQFACLVEHVLPGLPDPITVWSAGCANGQEPYSLAMALTEAGRVGWRVLASDVSGPALERTRDGSYAERELRGLSGERRDRFLVPEGSRWRVAPELRAGVHVFAHNLAAEPPPVAPGACAVVFCRNVLIYFRAREVGTFVERLAEWLPPEGALFLGFSESLWGLTDRFRAERFGDAFVYRHAPSSGIPKPTPAAQRRSPSARVHRRRAPPPPAPPRRPAPPLPAAESLLAQGERAVARGDGVEAIAAFRQAAYLNPDDPVAHLHLGLSLDGAGHRAAALRAFGAARAALDRDGVDGLAEALEGFDAGELARLLDAKLGRSP